MTGRLIVRLGALVLLVGIAVLFLVTTPSPSRQTVCRCPAPKIDIWAGVFHKVGGNWERTRFLSVKDPIRFVLRYRPQSHRPKHLEAVLSLIAMPHGKYGRTFLKVAMKGIALSNGYWSFAKVLQLQSRPPTRQVTAFFDVRRDSAHVANLYTALDVETRQRPPH